MQSNELKELRRAVMAAMETGNQRRARMLLDEAQDVLPQEASTIRSEVLEAYGYSL